MTLADTPLNTTVTLRTIGGERAFRRRLMELGLLPGVPVRLLHVAPLGDPMELEVRGARLSIRREEASQILVDRPGHAHE